MEWLLSSALRLTRVDLFLNLLLAIGEQEELETEIWLASTSATPQPLLLKNRIHADEGMPSRKQNVPIRRVHGGDWMRKKVVCRVRAGLEVLSTERLSGGGPGLYTQGDDCDWFCENGCTLN